jgi:two-component system sensor histidine kinase/response regulator
MTDSELPRLLIVDDEPANRTLLERLLSPCYRLTSVDNGRLALDMLVQAPFDLVLLDIMMPGMNGLEVLQTIRSKEKIADLPVILVSALTEKDKVIQGLRMRANDYLTKPFDPDMLVARVQTQLMLKQFQDERKKMIAELRAAQEMKDHFFRIASHDLKNPLMNISMAASLLKEMADKPGNFEFLDIISQSVETMQSIISEYLDTAALQTGAVDLHIEDVAAGFLVENAVNQFHLNAFNKDIALHVGETGGLIRGDASRLGQVLNNLVSNAIKYSPRGSAVSVWAEADDYGVRICVADQGPGIPADERDRLFTQFGKLSPRPTEGESSSGLGLWIVKHLVSLQGGSVGVECPPDGGSMFWIRMPAAE